MNKRTIGLVWALGVASAIQMGGCKGNPAGEATASASQAPASGKVSVTVGQDGFVPSSITANKGQPLTLEFKRITDKTCATQVVFPELAITKDLPLNTVVAITIPTDQSRKVGFQCGMGMYKSSVVIQ